MPLNKKSTDPAVVKSDELFEKYLILQRDMYYMNNNWELAKCSAITCVDEIIKNKGAEQGNDPIFWFKVKDEISKL